MGSAGEYVLTNLPVGPYTLEAVLPGFRTFSQTGIVLQVGGNPVINVRLEVGELAESISVVASAMMVETRNTGIGQVIDEKQIVNLPLNGRQPTQLVLLSGAAVINNTGGLVGSQRQYPSALAISVAGGTGNATAYLVDGGYNNDPLANLSQPLPFPDALQEFKVESGVRPARYGVLPGATVNAVTKAGANDFHGTGFGFFRDHSLNARNAFATTDDGLSRQQWGGTVGGPVALNRVFFFGGYQ
ncbi:MAG TPA: carboxypeptidase-like regulatory domain-containing protein, partial [Vicinamibacterales bacterium]|nr:carboxypeptidase-like regulatory domain-containing protein [Vicinamibacterales bacterium]